MKLMKFSKLKIGDLFYYNGFVYRKHSDTQGFNVRLGLFTIHPEEELERINLEELDGKLQTSGLEWIVIITIPFVMLALYLVMWCFE